MQRISHPSALTLIWLLLPAIAMVTVKIFLQASPWWLVTIIFLSLAAYLTTLTYQCIRQKCYKQLVLSWISVILAGVTFYINFWIIGSGK